jgi:hypothetical protein
MGCIGCHSRILHHLLRPRDCRLPRNIRCLEQRFELRDPQNKLLALNIILREIGISTATLWPTTPTAARTCLLSSSSSSSSSSSIDTGQIRLQPRSLSRGARARVPNSRAKHHV